MWGGFGDGYGDGCHLRVSIRSGVTQLHTTGSKNIDRKRLFRSSMAPVIAPNSGRHLVIWTPNWKLLKKVYRNLLENCTCASSNLIRSRSNQWFFLLFSPYSNPNLPVLSWKAIRIFFLSCFKFQTHPAQTYRTLWTTECIDFQAPRIFVQRKFSGFSWLVGTFLNKLGSQGILKAWFFVPLLIFLVPFLFRI